ncbi:unnamed protein product [Caenorhabditis auriculariae]|uniref:Sodium/nucleoside cotransporter n=1 Tax=Caenorhabditis auriculariae TaxID=2777116 RepID=A0A8S1HBB1_9PELO|nr:unnamed protein product [Caenorhabditis auriculariae]
MVSDIDPETSKNHLENGENGTKYEKKPNIIEKSFTTTINSFSNTFAQLERIFGFLVKPVVIIGLLVLYHGFLVAAGIHNFRKAAPLIYITLFFWLCFIVVFIVDSELFQRFYARFTAAAERKLSRLRFASVIYNISLLIAVIALLIIDTISDPSRLRGLAGYAFFLVIMFLFSNNKLKINWGTVVSAFSLHFLVAYLILRWNTGKWLFQHIAQLIVKFLDYAQQGTAFVFGFIATPPNICGLTPVFIFTALQTLIYFGAVVALLFYFGVIQAVLKRLSWFMKLLVGTTGVESMNAWGTTFLGMSEAPIMLAPYLGKVTASEMHAILASGFACTSGTVFAAYISLGACPDYLLTSSLMSAPCSLGCAKLLFPETEKTESDEEELEIGHGNKGILESLSAGATAMMIFGYILFPVAYLMGVTGDSEQTLRVAELMGTKTIVNEFVAYKEMGEMQTKNQLLPRSAMIATYALCGFSNICSMGMQIETLGALAPAKKSIIVDVVVRALMAGAIACFMNATVAGILIDNPTFCTVGSGNNGTCFAIPS